MARGRPVRDLFSLAWLRAHENVLFCGPVGVGKSFLASALGHSACRAGPRFQFVKAARLLQALHQSRADNSFERELRSWVAPDLVILDDFGLRKLTAQQSSDLYDVLVERHTHAATIMTSNRAVEEWVALFDDRSWRTVPWTASRTGPIRSSWTGRASAPPRRPAERKELRERRARSRRP